MLPLPVLSSICFCIEYKSDTIENLPLTTILLQRGETALHMAARAGQADVVRYLLKNGANVDTKSKVRTLSLINHCSGDNKNMRSYWARSHFVLLCRMTRQRCTLPVGWGKWKSSNSCCTVAPLPTLPPPQATPPFTWLPAKDTKMLLPCCWRTKPHSNPQLRSVRQRLSNECTKQMELNISLFPHRATYTYQASHLCSAMYLR